MNTLVTIVQSPFPLYRSWMGNVWMQGGTSLRNIHREQHQKASTVGWHLDDTPNLLFWIFLYLALPIIDTLTASFFLPL